VSVVEWISAALLAAGAFFAFTGGVGLFRMPDFFSRIHAAGVTDTAGAGLILAGLMLQAGDFGTGARLALILLFLLFTTPTAAHALAQAALKDGLKPLLANRKER
jgi:multicomponent Na+:H+ antiporter subunit G